MIALAALPHPPSPLPHLENRKLCWCQIPVIDEKLNLRRIGHHRSHFFASSATPISEAFLLASNPLSVTLFAKLSTASAITSTSESIDL
ncbi:hypothetical protein YC2023_098133 [Brassica napus]